MSYIDRENTNPGIPIERSYTVTEAGTEPPRLTVYRTNMKMIPDDSPEARAQLKRIAGRENKGATLYKPLTVARHPDYVARGSDNAAVAGEMRLSPASMRRCCSRWHIPGGR